MSNSVIEHCKKIIENDGDIRKIVCDIECVNCPLYGYCCGSAENCLHNIRLAKKYVAIAPHAGICEELGKIYIAKNHDYGNSFGETFAKLGIISAVTRISDKVSRLQSLCVREQKVHDESFKDTLLDLANYAIMTLIELDKNNNTSEIK